MWKGHGYWYGKGNKTKTKINILNKILHCNIVLNFFPVALLNFIINNEHDEVIKNGLELAKTKTLAPIGEELKKAYTKVYDKFKK